MPAHETLRTILAKLESLPSHNNVIHVVFQARSHREIVHGHSDNQPISRFKLFNEFSTARKNLLFPLAQGRFFVIYVIYRRPVKRQGFGSKFGNILVVEVQHGRIRQFLGQAINEAVGAIRSFILGIRVGVNNKGLHGVSW